MRIVKWTIYFLLVVAILFSPPLSVAWAKSKKNTSHLIPVVVVAKVHYTDWQPKTTMLGTIIAEKNTPISSETDGIVDKIYFASGDQVKKGQVLVTLRNAVLRAGQKKDQIDEKSADDHYKRYVKLSRKGFVTTDNLEDNLTALEQAKALLEKDKALIDQTIIRAPFTGKIGIRKISQGQYLSAGDEIATIVQLSPIYVDFSMPQRALTAIALKTKVEVTSSLYPDKVFHGIVLALDNQLTTDTKSLVVRAKLDNTDTPLLPGMFVTVNVLQNTPKKQLTVPQSAIIYRPYGDGVYVIKNHKASLRHVTVGSRYNDQIIIKKGLQAGEEVVSQGQDKLHDGVTVTIAKTLVK